MEGPGRQGEMPCRGRGQIRLITPPGGDFFPFPQEIIKALVSTWMADRLGIPGAVSFSFPHLLLPFDLFGRTWPPLLLLEYQVL